MRLRQSEQDRSAGSATRERNKASLLSAGAPDVAAAHNACQGMRPSHGYAHCIGMCGQPACIFSARRSAGYLAMPPVLSTCCACWPASPGASTALLRSSVRPRLPELSSHSACRGLAPIFGLMHCRVFFSP